MNIDADTLKQVVESVARTLCDYYVFPEIGQQLSNALHTAYANHAYDGLTTPDVLCGKLTDDIQAICHDKHVRVRFNEDVRAISSADADEYLPEEIAAWIAQARRTNFGFYKIERLDGNVGYLDFRMFWEVGWEGVAETAVGAMNALAYTDALIIDMRQNGGGSPTMVAFMISFLVDPEPVHLHTFYNRHDDKMRQSWTLPYIPGRRTPDKPVYVLTSKYTFSGAEEFTYNLKNLKRATIVGETTGGGAHPGRDFQVMPHFRVFVPTGRPTNAISGTNWEGTGVEPDIAVPQEQALDHAYKLALKDVLAKLDSDSSVAGQAQAAEVRAALEKLDQ